MEDHELDAIRVEAAYFRIAVLHLAAERPSTLDRLVAELDAALEDLPANRRAIAIAGFLAELA